jgi:hypothetical protein
MLWDAVTAGNISGVRRAVESGADICKVSEDGTGKTLLHQAAFAGACDVFRFLVEHGADPNRHRKGLSNRDSLGPTPLHYAARYNRLDIVRYLVRSTDCNLQAKDDQGFTALDLAKKLNYDDIVEFLELSGARTGNRVRRSSNPSGPTVLPIPAVTSHPVGSECRGEFGAKTSSSMSCQQSEKARVYPKARFMVYHPITESRNGDSALTAVPAKSDHGSEDDWRWDSRALANSNHQRQPARHDSSAATQNVGNFIGNRSSVRQSKLYRIHESGNSMKSILGKGSLSWDVNRQQGAYSGPVFDATK